tara:strand:- start:1523 stop:1795 length:273 start_codon:yes stop_codon:yes gene_type:complete
LIISSFEPPELFTLFAGNTCVRCILAVIQYNVPDTEKKDLNAMKHRSYESVRLPLSYNLPDSALIRRFLAVPLKKAEIFQAKFRDNPVPV